MAQVNIRIDDGLKEKADSLFDELGLNMTTAINIFVRQAVRQGRIPFDITTHADPFYSDSNMIAINEAANQIERGQIVVKTIEELEMMENE